MGPMHPSAFHQKRIQCCDSFDVTDYVVLAWEVPMSLQKVWACSSVILGKAQEQTVGHTGWDTVLIIEDFPSRNARLENKR
jgi:hypothetical protein